MPRIPLQPETRAVRTLSVIVTALMVALAIAALAGAATLRHVDLDWRAALAGSWTVELAAGAPIDPDAPTADADAQNAPAPGGDGARVIAGLRGTPGILGARIVGQEEVERLLRPWLGDPAAIRELPLPTLIDIRLDPANPPSFAVVQQKIESLAPGARLDDHGAWTNDLTGLARTGEVLGLCLFAIIALAATATVATAARARLAINRAEIQLLHRIGASDLYVIRQFQIDALWSAVLGAVIGGILAAGAGFALIRKGVAFAPLLPRLRLEPLDWCALAAAPAGAVLITILVAQWTAWALVRRLP
jgi:cell division transport system permease protein